MATVTTANGHASEHHEVGSNYLNARKGVLSWLFTLDHKRIGVMYLAGTLFFFMIGGILALLVRTELLTPAGDLFQGDTYNRVFTLHGAIMVFIFIIPSVPAALGNFVLPLMLGTKDVAFPRINLLSFWIWMLGTAFLLYSIIAGSVDTGWTFYTPYSSDPQVGSQAGSAIIWALMGVFILGFSSILTGVNFITTVHKMRAPGMTWTKMPLFIWGIYATAVIQVLATPVLAITLLLLTIERTLGIGIFDPALGGDPVLFQHFFWFYSHPAVYIMILPGMAIISELVTVHSKKNIFGYKPIAYSSMAIAIISFLVWGHHMFTSGQSELASTVFSALTFAVAVPTAIKVFSWVATLYKGSISLNTPMLYCLSFLFLFTIGGLTGLFCSTLATDIHIHDTYFVVAHFHYVMMGGTVIAFLGGLHHWWPKMTGRWYNENWGRFAAALVFIGFNVTFFSQFVLGSQGMPRRYHTYHSASPDLKAIFTKWHQVSTVGSYILAAGLFITLFYLLHSLFRGKKVAEKNPWGAKSLEWLTETPPIEHNFHEEPVCLHGPYDYDEISPDGQGAGADEDDDSPLYLDKKTEAKKAEEPKAEEKKAEEKKAEEPKAEEKKAEEKKAEEKKAEEPKAEAKKAEAKKAEETKAEEKKAEAKAEAKSDDEADKDKK
ncbi:MAG: cytochrome c oxidase subunit I [Myxococcales bacterium]|nr:cytochrome c oxidase subunit I [Myxococcales bacterium]